MFSARKFGRLETKKNMKLDVSYKKLTHVQMIKDFYKGHSEIDNSNQSVIIKQFPKSQHLQGFQIVELGASLVNLEIMSVNL